jgi:glutaminyl-tRNA synthetase
VDEDTKPDALVLNRIVTLRDSYSEKSERTAAAAPKAERKENVKAKTRPKAKSPKEYRAEARARDPQLEAAYESISRMPEITEEMADLLAGDRVTADLFVETTKRGASAELTAKWMINELPRALAGKELADVKLDAMRLGSFVELVATQTLTAPAAKQVLADMIATGKSPTELAEQHKAAAVSEDELSAKADGLIGAHPDKAAQIKAGKTGLLGFFVGQLVKAAPGADPKDVNRVLRERFGLA